MTHSHTYILAHESRNLVYIYIFEPKTEHSAPLHSAHTTRCPPCAASRGLVFVRLLVAHLRRASNWHRTTAKVFGPKQKRSLTKDESETSTCEQI